MVLFVGDSSNNHIATLTSEEEPAKLSVGPTFVDHRTRINANAAYQFTLPPELTNRRGVTLTAVLNPPGYNPVAAALEIDQSDNNYRLFQVSFKRMFTNVIRPVNLVTNPKDPAAPDDPGERWFSRVRYEGHPHHFDVRPYRRCRST